MLALILNVMNSPNNLEYQSHQRLIFNTLRMLFSTLAESQADLVVMA